MQGFIPWSKIVLRLLDADELILHVCSPTIERPRRSKGFWFMNSSFAAS